MWMWMGDECDSIESDAHTGLIFSVFAITINNCYRHYPTTTKDNEGINLLPWHKIVQFASTTSPARGEFVPRVVIHCTPIAGGIYLVAAE